MQDERFPTHEQIFEQVRELVLRNMNHVSQHNRESLDDLIADLMYYRDKIPTVEDYTAFELL